MNLQVFWVSEAEEELAAIWLNAADRNVITVAAHLIDSVLRGNPEASGESRGDGRRIFLEPPLGETFVVSPQDRKDFVLTIWQFEPGRR
jgi:hypothetical protein